MFHHMMAQIIFECKLAYIDIQTSVYFMTNQVKSPDEDDWVKSKRCMKYLKGTTVIELTL